MPDLPAELVRIVDKALEKDLDLRYQDASDLRADLKRLLRDFQGSGAHSPVPNHNAARVIRMGGSGPDPVDVCGSG